MQQKLLPIIILGIALTLTLCETRNTSIADVNDPLITSRIFESELGGYGYDILVNDTLFIHQPNIPVINDNVGFPTEAKAKQIADLVITKIRNHEVPPSVTHEELVKFSLSE
jgi:hypothetical protein